MNKPIPKSIIEQAIWMVHELEINPDKVLPTDYGRLTSNLAMLKINAVPNEQFTANWEALLLHCLYPDYNPFPEGLFLLPADQLSHYKLLLKALDDIYNTYTEE